MTRLHGLYVIDPERMYSNRFSPEVRMTRFVSYLTDRRIEEAKVIAKKVQLKTFAIIHINLNNIRRILYKSI